jgi:hypothetical protein
MKNILTIYSIGVTGKHAPFVAEFHSNWQASKGIYLMRTTIRSNLEIRNKSDNCNELKIH